MNSKDDEVAGHVSLRSKDDPAGGDAKSEPTGTEDAQSGPEQSVDEQIAEIERAAEARKAEIRKAAEARSAKAEKPAADQTTPAEPKSEEPKSEEPKAEEPKVDEPKAEEPKADEPKSEESKAEEPKADEPKAGTSAAGAAAAAAAATSAAAAKSSADSTVEDKVAEPTKSDDKPAEKATADAKPAETPSEPVAAEEAPKTEAKTDTTAEAETDASATAGTDTKADPDDAAKSATKTDGDAKTDGDKTEVGAGSGKAADDSATPSAASGGGGGGEPPDSSKPGSGARGGFPLPKSTKARVISAIAVVLVIAVAVGGFLYYRGTHVPDGVALRVDGEDITVAQLNDDIQTQKALLGFEVPKDGPQADEFRRVFAKSVAFTTVIEKAAAERNVVVADRQVSDVLARVIAQNYGDGPDGHDKSVQAMAANGTSEPKVLAEIKRQMTVTQLIQQVTAGIQASDQDVQQYFDTHKAELATPERRDIHNIVVKDKATADQLVAQLNAGANFEQLAQQQSMDSTTKDKGGDLGPQPAQAFESEFAKAAFSAPVNGIFGPVQGSHGFNVGRVVEILPSAPAVFDQIKDPLHQQVIAERGSKKWSEFLEDAVKKADVVYADEYRPKDPDSLPSPGGEQQQGPAPAGAPAPPK